MTKYDIKVFFHIPIIFLQTEQEALVMQRSRLSIHGLAMQYSLMHIVRSHAHCTVVTVLYVHETRATGYAEKTRY
jgi:hypothetical protein